MEITKQIKNMPKPELHRHIEGCVRPLTVLEIAKKRNLKLPTYNLSELENLYRVHEQGESLDKILERFAMAQNSFQAYEDALPLANASFSYTDGTLKSEMLNEKGETGTVYEYDMNVTASTVTLPFLDTSYVNISPGTYHMEFYKIQIITVIF